MSKVHVYERWEQPAGQPVVRTRRVLPGRLELRPQRPRVWRVQERPLPVQRPMPRGRWPGGKLKTTPEVKGRLLSRGSHGCGYRPSLLAEVEQGPETSERTLTRPSLGTPGASELPPMAGPSPLVKGPALPPGVDADAVMAHLCPPDPPGPLVGLSEILASLGAGKWSGGANDSQADPVASGDEGPADVGEALRAGTGTDSTGTTPDPLRPRSGPVKDMYVNGHGFRVFTGEREVNPTCRVCGTSIPWDLLPAVCDFTCQGCETYPERLGDAEEPIRVCVHDCQPTSDLCGCNGHLSAQRRAKPRVTCSVECFRKRDSQRKHVFKPSKTLVDQVSDLRHLPELDIATRVGVSTKVVRRIVTQL